MCTMSHDLIYDITIELRNTFAWEDHFIFYYHLKIFFLLRLTCFEQRIFLMHFALEFEEVCAGFMF